MGSRKNDSRESRGSYGLGIFSAILLVIQAICSVAVVGYITIINLLPIKYLTIAIAVPLLLWCCQFFLLQKSRTVVNAKRVFSVILSILVISVSCAVFWYLGGFISAFNSISSSKKAEYDVYTVRVMTNSNMNDIKAIKGKTIGISKQMSDEDLKKSMEELNSAVGSKPQTNAYEDYDSLASALMEGKTNVILFDEAMLSSIDEHLEGFSSKTRVLHEIKVKVERVQNAAKRENLNVTKQPFNIYISGMDSAGKIASRGNSDVNILMTVNPKENKILLTTTPRDFYVPLRGDSNKYDKLTHAGNYGVDCSMETIAALYNTPVDYYVKVNFRSVEGLVDALGGVTVDCDKGFTAKTRSGEQIAFKTGKNHLNGPAALAYSRERKTLAGGDRARGKHQQQIITALIDKLTSSSMLSNYNKVLNVIEKNTVTDFGTDEMTSLIKNQLSKSSKWNTESISVDGTGDSKFTYSYKKKKVYVMIPDNSTVEAAKKKIAEYMK